MMLAIQNDPHFDFVFEATADPRENPKNRNRGMIGVSLSNQYYAKIDGYLLCGNVIYLLDLELRRDDLANEDFAISAKISGPIGTAVYGNSTVGVVTGESLPLYVADLLLEAARRAITQHEEAKK